MGGEARSALNSPAPFPQSHNPERLIGRITSDPFAVHLVHAELDLEVDLVVAALPERTGIECCQYPTLLEQRLKVDRKFLGIVVDPGPIG